MGIGKFRWADYLVPHTVYMPFNDSGLIRGNKALPEKQLGYCLISGNSQALLKMGSGGVTHPSSRRVFGTLGCKSVSWDYHRSRIHDRSIRKRKETVCDTSSDDDMIGDICHHKTSGFSCTLSPPTASRRTCRNRPV